MSKRTDPMLRPLRDPKKRDIELKLLAEWESRPKVSIVENPDPCGNIRTAMPLEAEDKSPLSVPVSFGDDPRYTEIGVNDGNFWAGAVGSETKVAPDVEPKEEDDPRGS